MKKRIVLSFVLLVCLTLIFVCLSVMAGSASIPLRDLARILAGQGGDDTAAMILLKIRLPRTLAALLLGGALALAGYMLQTFFHNPIAGPFVLGISSGARLMVAASLIAAAQGAIRLSSAILAAAAFLGALIAMGAVLLLSSKVRSMSLLIVGGVMIGYICTALTDILVHFASDADIVNLRDWTVGSFSGMKEESLVVCAWIVLAASAAVFLLSKPIGAYQLGESYARDMGVNIRAVRCAMILLSSLLAGCVAAFAGPVSFVGIAVPFLVKRLLGTAKPIVMIPACFLGGGVFCILSDILARTVVSPGELGISTVTAVLGAPVVLVIMLGRRGDRA
ncbi:MAG: iron ABC transporter permease [Clostridiales bacterium]|nr:iron ABC transporter permease [Clostridiales bacterium]